MSARQTGKSCSLLARPPARVGIQPSILRPIAGSNRAVNQQEYNHLLASLNDAVAILARNRTPDPSSVAAYDTLKHARAMILSTIVRPGELPIEAPELAAA